jgi:hypothetical protein
VKIECVVHRFFHYSETKTFTAKAQRTRRAAKKIKNLISTHDSFANFAPLRLREAWPWAIAVKLLNFQIRTPSGWRGW